MAEVLGKKTLKIGGGRMRVEFIDRDHVVLMPRADAIACTRARFT